MKHASFTVERLSFVSLWICGATADWQAGKQQPKQKKQKKGNSGLDDDEEVADVSKLDAQSQAR